ncbi:globin domain-containing protein [Williamsia soli]|uniref:globin domain-containing protein n=1 Tax=Williamsia soli TaxID=364929 RepID=UPI001A9E7EEA|nr:globin domain-containing protein [Williamsia soli]
MDKDLLEHSLTLVGAGDPDFTVRFYERLFDEHPSVRDLFGTNIRPQAAMLQQAIVAVLDHLDDPGWLHESLGSLGRVHASLGVTPQMYGWVATTLVSTMAGIGGDKWTDAMSTAWKEALTTVAVIMLDAYPTDSKDETTCSPRSSISSTSSPTPSGSSSTP